MKYCSKCGNELVDEAVVCVKCGCAVGNIKSNDTGLETAIKIFMILGTVFNIFIILPIIWCIPMTVHTFKSIDNKQHIGIGFKICSLLFVSLVGGILLLCRNERNYIN